LATLKKIELASHKARKDCMEFDFDFEKADLALLSFLPLGKLALSIL
jgi:hypothetical protein